MEPWILLVMRTLQQIETRFGLVPIDVLEELADSIKNLMKEGDKTALEQIATELNSLTADDTTVLYERCLGRLDQLLYEVRAEIRRLESEPPELTEDQRKVLAIFQDSDVSRTAHQVTMAVNAALSVHPPHTREVLESLVDLGLLLGESHQSLKLYGPMQEQPVRA
jgi:glutamyl-tRNA reductase